MSTRWQTLERVETSDGQLELQRRGESDDFLIMLGGRVLMNSHANRSEIALSELALQHCRHAVAPRVLIGGLGMGCTLRAALDVLPASACVTVSELNADIVAWCRGPLARLSDAAVEDPRVSVEIEDVARRIASSEDAFDAILLDLYEGPHAASDAVGDPFYGKRALARTRRALAAEGVFAVWSERRDARYEERLRGAGFTVECHRPGRGGLRHAVTLAR